ncbi:MAG: LTA synthase family protein [Ruminococcaceae bacterium]|nr:LTA synthase family protein [Oscillospiraceae bacterium]
MHLSRIKNIIKGEPETRLERWLRILYCCILLILFSAANGLLALWLTAGAYPRFPHDELFASYFGPPLLVTLNLLPPLLLMVLGWFLFARGWAAYLLSALPTLGMAVVNYIKLQLRGDPFLASDLRLIRTAAGFVGSYSLSDTMPIQAVALCTLALFLISIPVLPAASRKPRVRILGTLACCAAAVFLYTQVYLNADISNGNRNTVFVAYDWSEAESSVTRGCWYPFILSFRRAVPSRPVGYRASEAEAMLSYYADSDIPPEKQVNVLGVMLEAFADLSDFQALAQLSEVREVYAPLHALEAQSVSGNLLTNIFAGGTVDTEWGFLTGYSQHDDFRTDVDSYVRYFSAQGYSTVYRHPGHGWYYNRENINRYLGFDESMFLESGFDELVSPEVAPYHSDRQLFDFLLTDLDAHAQTGKPLFSFSVSFQNHGPYGSEPGEACTVDISAGGWSAEACGILDNYLSGVSETIMELARFTQELERRDEPVVLVVFGDHKPWLGNNASVYEELGVDLDLSAKEGFYNYYATPYFIWANSAAKKQLGCAFVGDGGDCSPCFLMMKLFDLCSWEGPGFMKLARVLYTYTPLAHVRWAFLINGELTSKLSDETLAFFRSYRCAEYWRERHGLSP